MDAKLLEAARTGDVKYLRRLIEEDPLLLDGVALGGAETPLHVASMCGHLPFVQEVLRLRKQFAYECNQNGFTPLHLASANGHLEIVLHLLKSPGPDLCSIQGREGMLALHCAVVKGRIEVMKALLATGPPECVEKKTARGETLLHLAVKNNQFDAFELLVEHALKKLENVKVLLNQKDNQGNTVLHYAASRQLYQVIRLLVVEERVGVNVDVNVRNEEGMTPLDVVLVLCGDLDIHTALLEKGAKRGRVVDMPNSELDIIQSGSSAPPPAYSGQQLLLESIDNNNNNNNNNNRVVARSQSSVSGGYEVSDALITALALIATATYQAVLSPPGGLWQDDDLKAIPRRFAGKSIMATESKPTFVFYLIGNSIGFYSSIVAIFSLVESNLVINISLGAVSFSYAFSATSIVPHALNSHKWVLYSLLSVCVIIFGPYLFAKMWSKPRRTPSQHPNP